MPGNRVLIKPAKGETKEQFKGRLKAALGVGDTGAGGRADVQGESAETVGDPDGGQ